MDDDRLNPHTGQQGEIAEHRIAELGMGYGGTAVLDHDATAGEALDIGQCFAQNRDPKSTFRVESFQASGRSIRSKRSSSRTFSSARRPLAKKRPSRSRLSCQRSRGTALASA